MRRYKAILFDVGDTLIHYCPTSAEVIRMRLELLGIRVETETAARLERTVELRTAAQIYDEICGAPRMEDALFAKMLDDTVLAEVGAVSESEAFAKSRGSFPQTKVVDEDAFILLEQLKQRYRLGIVSNYGASLVDDLKRMRLSEYFGTIIVSAVVGLEKPNPDIFIMAAHELACRADECLYVGDHPFDVMGAVSAGMDAAWLKYKFHEMPSFIKEKPNYTLEALHELNQIL